MIWSNTGRHWLTRFGGFLVCTGEFPVFHKHFFHVIQLLDSIVSQLPQFSEDNSEKHIGARRQAVRHGQTEISKIATKIAIESCAAPISYQVCSRTWHSYHFPSVICDGWSVSDLCVRWRTVCYELQI